MFAHFLMIVGVPGGCLGDNFRQHFRVGRRILDELESAARQQSWGLWNMQNLQKCALQDHAKVSSCPAPFVVVENQQMLGLWYQKYEKTVIVTASQLSLGSAFSIFPSFKTREPESCV